MKPLRPQPLACVGAVVISAICSLVAPTVAHSTEIHPDLGGMWEHSATSHVKRSEIPWTSQGRKLWEDDLKQHWHNGVSEENTYCLPSGMPFMMSGSEGFDISSNSREILIVNEERPSPRHIYVDGRKHENMKTFDRTTVGNSIGRWEGDTLVVDTIGFLAGGTVMFVRTENSHLVERYHLEDHGKHLRISFRWDDPTVLSQPYVYEFLMDRAPPDRLSLEYYCDPRDPARAKP